MCTTTLAVAQSPPAAMAATTHHICTSKRNPQLADRLSHDIHRALRGRTSIVGLRVVDPHLHIYCWRNSRRHFYSASVVKATILAALLRKIHIQNRGLTTRERSLAWRMITQSDNNAATTLWYDVGMRYLQGFLNRASMTETELGQDGYWGLTRITAHDETLLLWLLMKPNKVLTRWARHYELRLMANVIASQRWGVSAGAPTNFTLHLKNGWAPLPYLYSSPWYVHSIGAFTRLTGVRDYSIVILTYNPRVAGGNGLGGRGMSYGITTIERVAYKVNVDLTPTSAHASPAITVSPSWGTPDEVIPSPAAAGG